MPTIRTVIAILFLLVATVCAADPLPVTWADHFHSTGPNATTRCLIHWQGDVVIAGAFDAVGQVPAPSHVARLHDGAWESLGDAALGSEVMALAVHDEALLAVAKDGSTYQVVRWDGEHWLDVGDPCPPAYSFTMASFGGDLYVGPYRLEGETWVDRLQADDTVRSLVVMDDLLVAGGRFNSAAGVATGHVLGWDGTNVINAFAGQDSSVTDLAVWNGQLYASRSADYPSDVAVQVWQDSTWVDIPELGQSSMSRHTTDLEPGDGRLLACGYWESFILKAKPSEPADRSMWGSFATSWDGNTATLLGEAEGFVEYWEILEDGGNALVAGEFATAGEPPCANLGRIINGAVTPVCGVGLGASDRVGDLRVSGDVLAVGGSFASIGALFSRSVAVFVHGEPGSWLARDLGNGDELGWYDSLGAVGWHNGGLYVVAGGHMGGGAGYWNGTEWHMTDQAGDYPTCGELLSWRGMLLGDGGWNGVLRFVSLADPTTFAEVDGRVIDMAVVGSDLVVGGDFDSIEGVAADNVAIYSDGSWQALGGGLPDRVNAVGSWQGQPVATTYGDEYSGVYRLEGDVWVEIGLLNRSYYMSLAEYEGHLFVGGSITSPADDGTMMVGLGCWTGTQWRSISGSPAVRCMTVYDEKLWLGGSFHLAGGVPAWHLTYLTADDITAGPGSEVAAALPILAAPTPNPFNPQTSVTFNLPAAADARLDVFDARGRRIARLVDGYLAAGPHTATWNGRDADGRDQPSGVYLLRLEAGEHVATGKMTLAR